MAPENPEQYQPKEKLSYTGKEVITPRTLADLGITANEDESHIHGPKGSKLAEIIKDLELARSTIQHYEKIILPQLIERAKEFIETYETKLK